MQRGRVGRPCDPARRGALHGICGGANLDRWRRGRRLRLRRSSQCLVRARTAFRMDGARDRNRSCYGRALVGSRGSAIRTTRIGCEIGTARDLPKALMLRPLGTRADMGSVWRAGVLTLAIRDMGYIQRPWCLLSTLVLRGGSSGRDVHTRMVFNLTSAISFCDRLVLPPAPKLSHLWCTRSRPRPRARRSSRQCGGRALQDHLSLTMLSWSSNQAASPTGVSSRE